MLHEGDPIRRRMAQERMKCPPFRLTPRMIEIVAGVVGRCAAESPWKVCAASIEATHLHLLITYSGKDIYNTAKWLADRATKAVHREADYAGPVWCKGNWCSFIFDERRWKAARDYIERHNVRRGLAPRAFPFVDDSV
jgi:REP element-mobilizing transposase RayT